MQNIKSSNQENGLLWLLKIGSGVLILVILGIHLVVNHLVAQNGLLTYEDILAYFQNPWVIIMETVFLVTAVTHALSGLRSIVLDLNPPARLMMWINRLFVGFGLLAVIYGFWLLLVVSGRIHM